jgi:hypothetical protein
MSKTPQVWCYKYKWLPKELYELTLRGEPVKALLETEILGAASHEHLNRLHHSVDTEARLTATQRVELFQAIDTKWTILSGEEIL